MTRRQIASNERDDRERGKAHRQGDGIGRRDLIQLTREQPRSRDRSGNADCCTKRYQSEAVTQYEPAYVAAPGAERHPDANLAGALRRDVRDEAVQPDARQSEREDTKSR